MFSKDVIGKIADLVRKSLELSCPYDPVLAVEKLGGNITDDITDMAIDASVKKEEENSFIIRLNGKKPFLRERFSIAHELGHLFLHMGFLINRDFWKEHDVFEDSVYYRNRMSGNYNQEESEANEFAAAFLMPRDEFKDQVYKNISNNKLNINNVAIYFQVSLSAALTRAKWLGYVEW